MLLLDQVLLWRHHKIRVFIISISFFDEVSIFPNRILTNQKKETVRKNANETVRRDTCYSSEYLTGGEVRLQYFEKNLF